MFANCPGNMDSIPDLVIPKTQKMVLGASLLNTQHYRYGSRVQWSNPGKGVAPSPTPGCSSYRKGSLRVTLDYGRQFYLLYLYSFEKGHWHSKYYSNNKTSFTSFRVLGLFIFTQPLRSGRIWHKVNFKMKFNRF